MSSSNDSLKIIERMIESVYAELKIATQDDSLTPKAYNILKEALVDAIDLKLKVENARAWNLS